MLFNSLAFLLAFPLFAGVFLLAPARSQPALALIGSLAACATFGGATFAWLIVVTALGYLFGRGLAEAAPGRLTIALIAVTAPLLVLKYTNFVLRSLQVALASVGIDWAVPHYDWVLPVGISFYTFGVIAYLVDVYVGRLAPVASPYRFALFTSFYPKFIAGPIERAGALVPQADSPKRFDYARVTDGIRIMGGGMFKKLVVADRLGVVVSGVYDNLAAYRGLTLALTGVLFMFQLYYDFCGYSEMAVGAARVLGYDLVWNFDRPYAARSVSEYWRRWHISLTAWLFEYIFAPVAAASRGWKSAGIVLAMMTTFLVSGLWHGAQWTFVIYGLVHGVAMCIDYLSVQRRRQIARHVSPRLYAVLAWLVTFTFVGCSDVLFRSSSIQQAGLYFYSMAAGMPRDILFLAQHHFSTPALKALMAGFPVLKIELVLATVAVLCVELIGLASKRIAFRDRLLTQPVWVRWTVYYLVAGSIVFLGAQNGATVFLYMRF